MEAIGQLAGGVAHDFNNLLTAILGNLALVLNHLPASDPSRELLETSQQAALRAADLTRQLLGFSRRSVLRPQPLDVNHALAETAGLLRRTIDPRIVLEVRPAPGLWTVHADPTQINQVLMNLCLNARDAMPQGGRLVLEADNVVITPDAATRSLQARPGEFVRIRVTDTGQGILPEVQPHIFEPFFTTKGPTKGTGLGLAMVYGIVQQHEGWIEFASQVGQGTRFDVYLPRYHAPRAADPAAPPADAPRAPARGHETILLVDDEAIIRNLGRTILQMYGYQVLLAEDGIEAIETYRRERDRIDLVILDLTMPRLSGADTLRQLRQLDPGVRVLLSSGYAAELNSEGGEILGIVNKPYRPEELADTVRRALDQARPNSHRNGTQPANGSAPAGPLPHPTAAG
jgi:CheY-like chemotaxis protein